MKFGIYNIRNVMEEIVRAEVDRLFDAADAQKPDWFSCTCSQCRGDVVCYVLNKIPPRYIRSARGTAHHINTGRAKKSQVEADISAIALEGMKQVSNRKRPHSADAASASSWRETPDNCPVFNFPAITGRVLDGLSFEPLAGAKVEIFLDGELCKPLGMSWENPCITNEHTQGNFAFAVMPIPASFAHERKVFDFEIRISAEGKDTVVHFVKIGATGEKPSKGQYNASSTIVLPDIFLFPVEDKFDSMQ